MPDDRGRQFDILDKAVASRGYELYARPFIYRQDFDAWLTSYNQLAQYAESNSDNIYVARQWSQEKPRYANAPAQLLSKVRTANPMNYDTSISISGTSGCDCGCGSNIPTLPYSPTNIIPGNAGALPSRGGTNLFFGGTTPSVGDGIRNLYSPSSIPFLSDPGARNKLVDKSQVTSGIIVALVVGAVLWIVHELTKKNINA